MEVTYRNEPNDLRLIIRAQQGLDRFLLRGMDLWLCLFLGMVPGAIWLSSYGVSVAMRVVGAFGILIAVFLAVVFRKTNRIPPHELTDQTLRLDPRWIEALTPTSWSRRRWNLISSVSLVSGGVVIGIESGQAYVIPVRAFPSEEECRQLFALATEYWQAARHNTATSLAVPIPDWFQPPPAVLQTTCRIAPQDLVPLLFSGEAARSPQKTQPAATASGGRRGSCALVIVLAAALALWANQHSRMSGPDPLLLGILYVGICGIFWFVGWVIIKRWRIRIALRKMIHSAEELTLSYLGCLFRSHDRVSLLHWQDVRGMNKTDAGLYIKLKANNVNVLPKSSFASSVEFEQFHDFAQNLWENVHDPSRAIPAYLVDTGNPYQPPTDQ